MSLVNASLVNASLVNASLVAASLVDAGRRTMLDWFAWFSFDVLENRASKIEPTFGAREQEREGPSDAELIERGRDGDRLALTLIYRRYAPLVTDMATRMLQRRAEADDVAQDTFTVVFTSLHKLQAGQTLRAWILTIAIHRIQRRFRTRAFTRWVPFESAHDAPLEGSLNDSFPSETRAEIALLSKAVSRLSPEEQVAFGLRMIEGLELTEVAEIMNLSLATVKRRLQEADLKLRKWLAIQPSTGQPSSVRPT